MKKSGAKSSQEPAPKIRPSQTIEGRENQVIARAMDLAEKQIMEGTASSQVITHFLKLGSTIQRLEKEKLQRENELLKAKTEALESAKHSEELYANALTAMRHYSGNGEPDDNDY